MAPDGPPESEARKKRRRKVLTLHEKMTILSKIEQGRTYSSIAREYGCNESSIRTIKKCEDRIKTSVSMLSDPASVKTTCTIRRDSLIEQMEHLLNQWMDEQTARNVPLTSTMIRTQARSIYDHIKSMKPENIESSFSASKGWFERFRKRANLQNIVIVSEAGPAADDTVDTYKTVTCWTKVSPAEDSEKQEQASFSTEIEKIISLSNMIEKEAFKQPEQSANEEDSARAADERPEEIMDMHMSLDVKDVLGELKEDVRSEVKPGISVNISKILKAAQFLKKKIMQEDPDVARSLRIRKEIDDIMQAYVDSSEVGVDPEEEPIDPVTDMTDPDFEPIDPVADMMDPDLEPIDPVADMIDPDVEPIIVPKAELIDPEEDLIDPEFEHSDIP